jgi:hypothetical protein
VDSHFWLTIVGGIVSGVTTGGMLVAGMRADIKWLIRTAEKQDKRLGKLEERLMVHNS